MQLYLGIDPSYEALQLGVRLLVLVQEHFSQGASFVNGYRVFLLPDNAL